MGKESKLFDKRFVHFMWDDELEGKQVFVADNINSLIERIEKGTSIYKVHWSRDTGMPFESEDLVRYRFAYYDENYSIKKAFNEGKKVQYRLAGGVDWADIDSEEALKCRIAEGRTFRIKPEDKWIAYLARPKYRDCYLTACAEGMWEAVQKEFDAKTKLFVGTCDEAVKWYESREKFTEIIKAWEDGKTIQVYETHFKKWSDCAGTLEWYTDCEYRVKPECPCADGIDSKACVGCPQDEERKQTVRPFKDCDELVEFWSKNYQTGFRAANTKPLIWVRLKCDGRERLIVAFGKGFGSDFVEIGNKAKVVPLQKLFDDYEFLNGSPVGREVKE